MTNNVKDYIEIMREWIEDGMIEKNRANDRVEGFIAASEGKTFKEYKAIQKDLVDSEYASKSQGNARIEGFLDYKN